MRLLLLLLLLTVAVYAKAVTMAPIGVSFDSAHALTEPEKVGLDAYSSELKDAGGKNTLLEIVVARISKEAAQNMVRENGIQPLDYAKGAFLGITKPATGKKSRTFGKLAVEGELHSIKIPRKGEVECYLVAGTRGNSYMVAFRSYGDAPEIEEVRAEVAKSWKTL